MSKILVMFLAGAASIYAQPAITAVANAATYQATFSPGSLAIVTGTNLVVAGSPTAVTIGTKAAAVITAFSVATQLLIEIPVDAPLGPTTLTVSVGGKASGALNLTIAAYAPAFETVNGVVQATDGLSYTEITAANPAKPGEPLAAVAIGLGPTNPPLTTGVAASGLTPITANNSLTLGGLNVPIGYAGGAPGASAGFYQVNFTVPAAATGCTTSLVLTVGGVAAPPVTLPIAITKPAICAIENAATGGTRDAVHGAAANSFVALYAAGLTGANSPTNIFPATNYQGTTVTYNGTLVPMYNVNPSVNLINTIVPSEAGSSGTGVFTVTNGSGTSSTYTVALAAADLGVFRLPDPKVATRIQGVVLVAGTYWFAMPASLASSYALPACTGLSAATPCGQPAKPGDNIVIYLTGAGLATPNADPNGKPVPTGQVSPVDGSVLYQTVLKPTITIGGISAPVAFSGIAPGTASEYQMNTTIPAGVTVGDDVPIVITMGTSTDTITISVAAK